MNPATALKVHSSITSAPRSWPKSFKKHSSSSKSGCGINAMPSWSNCKDLSLQEMKQWIAPAIRTDRLGQSLERPFPCINEADSAEATCQKEYDRCLLVGHK